MLGGQTRTFANDSNCIHETLLSDVAAEIRYLRACGFEKVILLGNSGGGSLFAFYQAQAATPPPGRLKDTPAGQAYDLNQLDMPLADALILLAAHLGEGVFGMDSMDPSVTDESDPLSCDPALDMFNPENGYRKPPESSNYSSEFLERYRAAQSARCARIDAMARADIERRRRYSLRMADPGFSSLAFADQLEIIRRATASSYLNVARMEANPAFADLSLHPSSRRVGTLRGVDPHLSNYQIGGFAATMTPEAWLSTWSGLSSRAVVLNNIRLVDVPLLVINYRADAAIFPDQSEAVLDQAGSADKQLVFFEAGHYGHALDGTPENTLREVGATVTNWLKERFPIA